MFATSLVTMRRFLGAAGLGSHSKFDPVESRVPGADLIYRLKAWPDLPSVDRTAEVYRMLSVMSSRPVNRQWIFSRTTMPARQMEDLLLHLVREGAIEVIDPTRFNGREPNRN